VKADRLAEAATLGSLLLEPAALGDVARWLRPGDFAHWWHAEMYTVMRERLAAGQPVHPEAVGLHLKDRLGPRRADLPRIVDLLQAAPVRPQPLRYAAMVLESSLRREIAGQGGLLRAAALSAALAQESRPLTAVTAMVEATLAAAEQRWQLASGEAASAVLTHAGLAPVLRNTDRALGADRLLSAHPALDQREVREHEQRLVAVLITHPAQVPATTRWLHPEALVDRPWRAVYSALVDLVERGEPADLVTVAWEVQRASRRRGPGPDWSTLARAVDAAATDDLGYVGRTVAGDLVRRTADSAARSLQAAAANPGVDVRDLVETGRLLTQTVCLAAAGLPERADDSVHGRHLQAVRSQPAFTHPATLTGPVAG
jgi:replicative DNA helicase